MDEISGVLVLDKPCGVTSHDMVNKLRRLYNTKRVGHTGTLDPMATGVLVILIGRAAKAAEFLSSDEKRYTAGLKLGITTDTDDTTGKILTTGKDIPDAEQVVGAVKGFVGKSKQIPPMYSAIKQNGRKLVDLARKGIEVERQPRDINIFSIKARQKSTDEYMLDVHVSKGTYIRTLCRDIGEKLGCGGCMSSLRRTASGGFLIENGYTLEALEEMDISEREKALLPTESLFDDLPKVVLPEFFSHLAHSGQVIYQKKIGTAYDIAARVALYDKNGFFAVGEAVEFEEQSVIKPIKQFVL